MDDVPNVKEIRVLELFAGIGGMRLALSYAGMVIDAVAVEVNQQALAVYSSNFGSGNIVNRDICSLTPKWFDRQQCQIWTMSPPCQPYTRQGRGRDAEDPRAKPLLHIIKVLREVHNPPEAIVLENVKNFEQSDSFNLLCEALKARHYEWRSFLLSPRQFGFPNARLRFYLVAKQRQHAFEHVPSMMEDEHEEHRPWRNLPCSASSEWHSSMTECRKTCASCGRTAPDEAGEASSCVYDMKSISNFLDLTTSQSQWFVPEETLQKDSARCFDVVHDGCCHSLCFTKAYGRYIDGTGSVYVAPSKLMESSKEPGSYAMQDFYGTLRYFSPSEAARLLGFKLSNGTDCACCLPQCQKHQPSESTMPLKESTPCCCPDFQLPSDVSRARDLWALLGNSLNPQVVGLVCVACELPKMHSHTCPDPDEAKGSALSRPV